MSKLILEDVVAGRNLQKINNNFAKIVDTLQNKVLYRDNPEGEPNELQTDIDANSHRIYNLPFPVHESEPVRLKDLTEIVEGKSIAALVSFEPYKTINSNNVQGAIQQTKDELDTLDGALGTVSGRVATNTGNIGTLTSGLQAANQEIAVINGKIDGITLDGAVQVLENVAAMKAANTAKIKYVQTKGYYTAGDGGGGVYYYDAADKSTANNNGTVIVGSNNSRWKLIHNGFVFAEQFGAKGDLVANDQPFLQAAINVLSPARIPLIIRKTYKVNSSLIFKNNTVILGNTAKVNADTAMGTAKTDRSFRSQPLICPVGGVTALKNNTTNTLYGLAFRDFGIATASRVDDDLPVYHGDAVFTPDTNGIDLAYTTDALVENVVGKGLGSLVFTSVAGRTCHRPVLRGIGGYSCNNLINFTAATGTSEIYCAADILVSDVSMVRMNNNSLVMDKVDGVTLANCKFFQAAYNNLQISNSGFVNIVGSTFFETGYDNVYIQDCLYVVMSGTIIARAGWYAWPLYSRKVTNLKIERCNIVKLDVQLERAAGYNYEFYDCGDMVVNSQNYYQWISAGSRHDGVIQNCFGVDLNIYSTRHTDDGSATGTLLLSNSAVKGRLPGNRPWALMNGDNIDMDTANGIVLWHRLTLTVEVQAKGSYELLTRHFTVPPGWSARIRNIAYDAGENVQLRVNTYFSPAATQADRPVTTNESGATIYTNNTGIPQHIAFSMYIYNPATSAKTIGAGMPFSASVEVAP